MDNIYFEDENEITEKNYKRLKLVVIILSIITLILLTFTIIIFLKLNKATNTINKYYSESQVQYKKYDLEISQLKEENKKINLELLKSKLNIYGIKLDENKANINYTIFSNNNGDYSILEMLKNNGIEFIAIELDCIINDVNYKTVHTFPIETPLSNINEYINKELDFQKKCINEYGISINSNEITWDINKYYKIKGNFEDSQEDLKVLDFLYTFNISNLKVEYKHEDNRYNWNGYWELNESNKDTMSKINKFASDNKAQIDNVIKNQ